LVETSGIELATRKFKGNEAFNYALILPFVQNGYLLITVRLKMLITAAFGLYLDVRNAFLSTKVSMPRTRC
jgi:hypothetical protein